MSKIGKLYWSLVAFAPLCALCADNKWQNGSGNWNEAVHWDGGVPVAAPPTGAGALQQRLMFPSGSYTVTFPEGDVFSTGNMNLNVLSGSQIGFSGLGSRLLLAATEGDNYQTGSAAQAFRFNYGNNQQGYNMTVTDKQAPLGFFTNFNVTASLASKVGRLVLEGGLYDFLTPTGGVKRTDTNITVGYEGPTGSHSSDYVLYTDVKNGALWRAPKLTMGTGYATNTISFSDASGEFSALYMNGTKAGNSRATMCIEATNGSTVSLGSVTMLNGATFYPYQALIRADGGSTLKMTGVSTGKGNCRFEIAGGSDWTASSTVYIATSAAMTTNSVSIVDSTATFADLMVGYDYPEPGEVVGLVAITGSTVTVSGDLTLKPGAWFNVSGTSDVTVVKNAAFSSSTAGKTGSLGEVVVSGGNLRLKKGATVATMAYGQLTISGGKVTSEAGITLSKATSNTMSYSGRLLMTDGELELPADGFISSCSYNAGIGYFELNGGTVRAKGLVRGADSGTAHLTANGGTIVPSSTDAAVSGMQTAVLGTKGLTIDSAFNQTLAQNFTSAAGVTGLLTYAGHSTLTVPAARTIDAALWMKGGTTLAYSGSRLGGLILGETDSAATVNVALGSPIAVTGDVDVRKAKFVVSGTCVSGTSYPLVTCTGDVSAGTAAALAAAEVVASLTPMQYVELTVADGLSGGKVLQMEVKDIRVVPVVVETTETISTNITLGVHDQVEFTVADGATLTLTGAVTGDSIAKRGSGTLVLGGDQALVKGAYLVDGTLSLAKTDALGAASLFLRGGTLAMPTAATLASPVVITPENEASAVVLKTDADVTMALPSVTGGALLKRGAGKLTFAVGADTSDFKPATVGGSPSTATVTFPASGVVPVAAYRGVHVVEGELCFLATTDGASIVNANSLAVGLNTLNGTAAPKLTLDGVSYTATGCAFQNGCFLTKAGCFTTRTYAALTNGAALTVGSYANLQSSPVEISCELTVDASTVTATDTYWPNTSDKYNAAKTTFRNGSALYAGTVKIQGSVSQHVFDDSILAKNANGDLTSLYQQDNKTTTFTFRNGATLCLKTIDGNSDRHAAGDWYSFVFEGATWNMGAANVTFTTPKTHFRIQTSGEGVVWAPPTGVTWTIAKDVLGDGKITVNGAGTVNFNGAAFEGRTFGGTGTIAGCTIGAATLAVDLADDWMRDGALTFDGSFPTGKVTVDLGRTAEKPMSETLAPFVAAKYTGGGTPDVTSWRLKNAGLGNVRAAFAAASGEVTATPSRVGMMLLVR